MSYYREYGQVLIPEFLRGEGWHDESWHNDACAKSVYYCSGNADDGEGDRITVWVEHESPAERESPDCHKFVVEFTAEDQDDDPILLYQGEDGREVVDLLAAIILSYDIRRQQEVRP